MQQLKRLMVHISLALGVFLLVTYLFFYWYLPYVTHHGEQIVVPSLKGIALKDLEMVLNSKKLRYVLYDSIYRPGTPPLSVVHQFPKAGEKVKEGRAIYVSVSSRKPPLIRMPSLLNTSLKQATMLLKSHGLVLGNVYHRYNLHEGAVLDQLHVGNEIKEGTWIAKGETIDLVVGSGLGSEEVPIPNLTGLSLMAAKIKLKQLGLAIGSRVYVENASEIPGTILRQKPEYTPDDATTTIRIGEIIDVWVAGSQEE